MFLATTGSTEFWDTSEKILLLNPGCLRYDRRADWEGHVHSVVASPWDDPLAVRDAERYCRTVIDALIHGLGEYLNEAHGVRRGPRYWRILLGGWLLYYVHALYDRYVSLQRVLNAHRELKTVVLSSSYYETPIDTLHFVSLAHVESPDLYNLQLYSQILKAIGFDNLVLTEVVPSDEGRDPDAGTPSISMTSSVTQRIIAAMARMSRPRVMLGTTGLKRQNLVRLVCAMAFHGGAWPCPQTIRCQAHRLSALREGLAEVPANDDFSDVLVRTLSTNLPLIFLEGYADFREKCLAAWRTPPEVLISSGLYLDGTLQFLAAEFAERGSRLVGVQHGAGYGTSKTIPQERIELSVADSWYSFGWSGEEGNGPVGALPHPRFLPLRAQSVRRAELRKDILLVTTSHPRYLFRFESYPVAQFHTVLEWRLRFLNALPAHFRDRVVVRLRSPDYGWCQAQRILDAFGPIRFSDGKTPLRGLIRRARLAVIEYCGTAVLDALAADAPTVLYWDSRLWELRDEAVPYFEGLRRVGILWDSPEKAAAKIIKIYDDPRSWWKSDTVQEARRNFVDRFALGRSDWLAHWVQALKKEIALSHAPQRQ